MDQIKAFINQSLINQANSTTAKTASQHGKPPYARQSHGRHDNACYHCGGDHHGRDCTHEKAGTKAYVHAALQYYRENTPEAKTPREDLLQRRRQRARHHRHRR